ncbi:glycosyltransferase family 2 protein [Parvularcula marina]|uniref:Glycosyltransferase family 2 protein n=1 Tax=Parvularcula marina TaxID=2292771 RepID=A0A371REV6_9PROT|nr:glycosyltransferase family 2 protein [Parvularcula marina]RFB03975.1 glycosyltransferase family 2 protein [Parvularcula marina]
MTQEGPALSVIIVNYNSGERLTRVFAALDRQTWRDFETLLVDNASSDDSASLAAEYPHLVTVKMSPVNTGFAGGVMIGAAMAKGEWLVVLNPDAYPESDWLEKLMAAAMEYGPETLLGSVQLTEDEEDRLDGLGDVYHMSGVAWRGGFGKSAALTPTEDREIFAPCFAAAALHRERFLSLGGLDEDFFCYHEDVDFGFRHRLAGGRAVLVHDAIVHHEGSGITGRYSDFTVFHGIRNRMWTFVKNTPLALMPVMLPAYLFFSAGFLLRSFMLGIGKPYMRGFAAGVKGLPRMLKKRGEVQKTRTAALGRIAGILNWSPIAPFRRAPDLRPISPPQP